MNLLSSLIDEWLLINIGVIAFTIFLIFTLILLAYLAIESQDLTTLIWRGSILIFLIPIFIIFLTIPLFTPLILGEVFLSDEQTQIMASTYLLFLVSSSSLCQIYYIRSIVLDEMQQRNMTFVDYIKYSIANRGKEKEETVKIDSRLRADNLHEKLDEIRPLSFGPKTSPEAAVVLRTKTSKPTAAIPSEEYYGIRWRQSTIILCIESFCFFIFLWIGLLSIDIWPHETAMGGALLIALLACCVFLFIIGMLIEDNIRMNETPLFVILAPMIAIIFFIYSLHFLLNFQSLRDTTFTAILAIMLFLTSALPVPLFFALFFGISTKEWIFTGNTAHRFFTRGKTLLLAGFSIFTIVSFFLINHLTFPNKDIVLMMIECVLLISFVSGLTKIPLDEKLIVGFIAPFFAIIIGLIIHLDIIPMILLLVMYPIFIYLIDNLDLQITLIRPTAITITILSLIPLSLVYYLIPYYFISHESFAIVLLVISITLALFAIKLNLSPEESVIIGFVLTPYFMFILLIEDFLPRYEQLTELVFPNLSLPFFILLLISSYLGQKCRANVLFIANDGHKLSNKGERMIDDWINDHGLEHKVHPIVGDSIQSSFLIKSANKEYYVKFWAKFKGADDQIRYHKFQTQMEEKKLDIDLVHPNDLDYLDSRLSYIVLAEERKNQGGRLSYW